MPYSYTRNYRTCTDAYIPKCIYTRWNQLEHSTCFSPWPRLVKQVMKNKNKFTIKARHCKIHNEYENNGSWAYNNNAIKKKKKQVTSKKHIHISFVLNTCSFKMDSVFVRNFSELLYFFLYKLYFFYCSAF